MANEESDTREETSLFGKITDAIARRSALIKQHEADYAALMVEKDNAVSEGTTYLAERDTAHTARDEAFVARDEALAALAPYEARVALMQAQMAKIAKDLGIEINLDPEAVEDAAELDPMANAQPAESPAAVDEPAVVDKPAASAKK